MAAAGTGAAAVGMAVAGVRVVGVRVVGMAADAGGTANGTDMASAHVGFGIPGPAPGLGSAIKAASSAEFAREPAHELDAGGEFINLDELVGLMRFVDPPGPADYACDARLLELSRL
jgi:hypothetical protein